MGTGELLEITIDDGAPIKNVPSSLTDDGHGIARTHQIGTESYRLLIRKGARQEKDDTLLWRIMSDQCIKVSEVVDRIGVSLVTIWRSEVEKHNCQIILHADSYNYTIGDAVSVVKKIASI